MANIADIHDGGKYGYKVSHPNTFIAVFVGDGSLNTKAVKRLLDSAKQSHTTYTIIDRMDTVLDCTTLEQMAPAEYQHQSRRSVLEGGFA